MGQILAFLVEGHSVFSENNTRCCGQNPCGSSTLLLQSQKYTVDSR